ncbi:MAG: type III-A CRISPR-associated RAMP protein Csm5 [Chloroflexi bacterium]|nr:MAG: type III-A CRISPR-associated RAMP protein Csm5 [Chloroflexota bacterium]
MMDYKVKITTLTPIHIGTGTELLVGYDLKSDEQEKKTYRLNVDAILEDAITGDNPHLDRRMLNLKPAELVELPELHQKPDFSIYTLKGVPQSGVVKEQIKTVWGKLYLPGSTLKGAFRTIIARSIAKDDAVRGRLRVKRGGPKSAADDIEKVLFGDDPNSRSSFRSPNFDLLRAMQVSDSEPVDAAPQLINVSVLKGSTVQAPIDLEAIPRGVTFEATIHLDDYLFKETRRVVQGPYGQKISPVEKLGWEKFQTKWLYNLPVAGRNISRQRFTMEKAYYQANGLTRFVQIYDAWLGALANLKGTQTFFLQVGWGGGWENKTMGRNLLASNDQEFAELRNDFNLGKPPQFRGHWRAKPDDVFPSSRRVRVNANKQPLDPLGWVEVTLEKIK